MCEVKVKVSQSCLTLCDLMDYTVHGIFQARVLQWGASAFSCSHEIKRCLLLERKVMTNLDSIFKSRDITFPTKVCLVKAWFFQWSCMDVRVGL